MPSNRPLEGVIVPVITPVDVDDRLDDQAFRAVLRRLIAAQVDVLFIGGTSGMGPLLTESEWRRMMAIARDEVPAEVPLLAGIMGASTARALELVRAVEALGYDQIVVTPSYYLTLTRDCEFLAHYQAIREATEAELIVYNIPPCTGSNLPVEVIFEMARRGWTRYCKDSSADNGRFAQLLAGAPEVGLTVFQGSEANMAWGLRQGAKGIVPGCANFHATPFTQIWQAAQAGDEATLDACQEQITRLVDVVVKGDHHWVAGLHYACHVCGLGEGFPLRPLRYMPEADARKIAALMVELGEAAALA